MLLGNKKNNNKEKEQNWCLILNPIASAIDRQKISRKISATFSLSPDEALDLVSNTPIILLDNLTRSIASMAKDYFSIANAEIFLTNDVYVKRKCYRAVWPEPPNLSFLNSQPQIEQTESLVEIQEDRMLEPEEALHEIRSMRDESILKDHEEEIQAMPTPMDHSAGVAKQERKQLEKEIQHWQNKNEKQRLEIEELKDRLHDLEVTSDEKVSVEVLAERNAQLQRQKDLLNNAEQRYAGLQEEYRQARTLLEDKIKLISQELNAWKTKAEETEGQSKTLSDDKSVLKGRIDQLTKELETLLEDNRKLITDKKSLETNQQNATSSHKQTLQKHSELEASKKQLIDELQQLRNRHEDLEKEIVKADRRIFELEETNRDLDKNNRELQSKLEQDAVEREELSLEISGIEKRLRDEREKQSTSTMDWQAQLNKVQSEAERAKSIIKELKNEKAIYEREIAEYREEITGLRRKDEETRTLLGQAKIDHDAFISQYEKEVEKLKGQQSRDAQLIDKLNANLEEAEAIVAEEKSLQEQSRTETAEKERALRYKLEEALKESQTWRTTSEDWAARFKQIDEERNVLEDLRQSLESSVDEYQAQMTKLKSEYEKTKDQIKEEAILRAQAEKRSEELERKYYSLHKSLKDQEDQLSVLKEQYQGDLEKFSRENELLKEKLGHAEALLNETSEKMEVLEKSRLRLVKELEERGQEADELKLRIKDLEYEAKENRNARDDAERKMSAYLEKIEENDRETDHLRRQVRDLHAQLEQRDVIQKRTQLAAQLTQKEESLKSLVKDQENIEQQIRDLEERMRKTLMDQESLEKEIIEGKQAQRHYLEQAKKEKSKPARFESLHKKAHAAPPENNPAQNSEL
ncbi:MAG: hypothetical protein H6757_05955 [Candidatus Omnitrophica bacterium]|nr:hypothetical protein [Candidatus Omnitrophota bacterium]